MFRIQKSFDFCYGHRVHSQVLDPDLSENAPCKCRHLHGHQGKVTIVLEGEDLNEQGMVIDFVNLNFFKTWLDDTIDHKFIIDKDDPILKTIVMVDNIVAMEIKETDSISKPYDLYLTGGIERPELTEYLDSFVVVPFIPTSENLSKWFFYVVQERLEDVALVSCIEFWETPKSCSKYFGE